jgi:hypothetical protein
MEPRTRYHLMLTDKTERDITAEDYEVDHNGALTFTRGDGGRVITYAPGAWTYVEVESKDDKD